MVKIVPDNEDIGNDAPHRKQDEDDSLKQPLFFQINGIKSSQDLFIRVHTQNPLKTSLQFHHMPRFQ